MKLVFVCLVLLAALAHVAVAYDLVLVHQDFSADSKWEAFNNRIVAHNGPLVKQDFGWMPDSPIPGTQGAIGGTIWTSTTPAFYALPFGRALTLDDKLSASGKIMFNRPDIKGAAYIGFFNHERQEWRPWSSLAIRLLTHKPKGATIGIDFMSGQWGGAGMMTDATIPTDGSVHTGSSTTTPTARPPGSGRSPASRIILPISARARIRYGRRQKRTIRA